MQAVSADEGKRSDFTVHLQTHYAVVSFGVFTNCFYFNTTSGAIAATAAGTVSLLGLRLPNIPH